MRSLMYSAHNNIALGLDSLQNSGSANSNVAIGTAALGNATGANTNVAIGNLAMQFSTGSSTNVAIGANALQYATNVTTNIAIGQFAMQNSTGATTNVAIGQFAMQNSTGINNVAIGTNALRHNLTGSNNLAIGPSGAGSAFTAGESNNIDIGNAGIAGDQSIIRIGTQGSHTGCFVAGIFTGPSTGGTPVYINSSGQLGTTPSSTRYKKDIVDLDSQHDQMLKLRPVSFHYKNDAQHHKQFGLIAEEVNEIYPEIVVRDEAGEIYSVNYMALIPLLLKQIQELEMQVQSQGHELGRIASLEEHVAELHSAVAKLLAMA